MATSKDYAVDESKPQAGIVERTCALLGRMKNRIWSDKGNVEYFRLLLLGKTGSGKSTTGNTILGEELFKKSLSFGSVTAACDLQRVKNKGEIIEIMDCPGLYDTGRTQEEICSDIVKAVVGMHPGPHAILYIVQLGRYTTEEQGVYTRLKALFDDNITNYMIIVFTRGDDLEASGQTLADLLKAAPKELCQVVEECGNRCIVFNNTRKNPKQVKELLQTVKQLKETNEKRYYTCPKYTQVGDRLEKEVMESLARADKKDHEREQKKRELEMKADQAKKEAERQQKEFEEREKERQRKLKEEEEAQRASEVEKKLSSLSLDFEKQREQDRLELEKKEREMKELLERVAEEKRKEEQRQWMAYEAELNRRKDEIAKSNEDQGFLSWAASSISGAVQSSWNWVTSWF